MITKVSSELQFRQSNHFVLQKSEIVLFLIWPGSLPTNFCCVYQLCCDEGEEDKDTILKLKELVFLLLCRCAIHLDNDQEYIYI